jgi:hypothetical protein
MVKKNDLLNLFLFLLLVFNSKSTLQRQLLRHIKKNTFIVIATFTKMEEFPILNILLTLKTLQTSPNTYV